VPVGSGAIAGRLVALLPRRVVSNDSSTKAQPVFGVAPNSWAVICVVLMALALGAQLAAAGSQGPARTDSAAASAATTYSPAAPPMTIPAAPSMPIPAAPSINIGQ
jgi:hypothetical protein